MREDAVERPRDTVEVERLHEQHRIALLAVPHEAVQLLLERSVAVRELLLVRPERAQLTLLREHALHSVRTDRTCQLVLEVARAGEEPGALELVAVRASECAQEMPLLADVVETRERNVAVALEDERQVPVATHRHDRDPFGIEIAAATTRERLDRAAVAGALDEHD